MREEDKLSVGYALVLAPLPQFLVETLRLVHPTDIKRELFPVIKPVKKWTKIQCTPTHGTPLLLLNRRAFLTHELDLRELVYVFQGKLSDVLRGVGCPGVVLFERGRDGRFGLVGRVRVGGGEREGGVGGGLAVGGLGGFAQHDC